MSDDVWEALRLLASVLPKEGKKRFKEIAEKSGHPEIRWMARELTVE